ncbi:hypothetical protein ACFL2Q_10070 [Thermodesulfobacteriota bacterium]
MKRENELRLTYGFLGLVFGAVIVMIIGFSWGDWSSSLGTKRMSEKAVLASHAAICVAQFMKEANHGEKLKEFEKLSDWDKAEFINKGGWATMPGGEKADLVACRACAEGLKLLIKK